MKRKYMMNNTFNQQNHEKNTQIRQHDGPKQPEWSNSHSFGFEFKNGLEKKMIPRQLPTRKFD